MEAKDPLKPFTTGVHEYDEMTASFKADIGVPISGSAYNKIFKEITSIPNFLHEEKAPILKTLYNDMKVICDAFSPLYKVGMTLLAIDLTGGAVRDFVLNRHKKIKDIDVMVSFTYDTIANRRDLLQITKTKLIEVGFTEEELIAVKWEEPAKQYIDTSDVYHQVFTELPEEIFNNRLNKIVCLALNRIQGNQQNFLHGEKDMLLEKIPTKDPNYEKSIRERLTGIIKIHSPKLKFPTDILITNKCKAEFMNGFDINLCKASFCFINHFYNAGFPKDYSHLISRFSSCMDFFADVHNKKMTFVVDDRADISIESSIKRLFRLQEKYAEHEFNIALSLKTDVNHNKLQYAKSLYFKKHIMDSIDITDKPNKQKMKI